MHFTANLAKMDKISTTSRTFGKGKSAKCLTIDFYECETHGQDKFFAINVAPIKTRCTDLIEFKRIQTFDSISMEKLVKTAAAIEAKVELHLG